MSKAFTSEDVPDDLPLGRVPERAAPGEARPITAEGYRRLTEERQALLDLGRPEDEDSRREYEHRLSLASATLDSVRVVDPPASNETVAFGHRVTLEWEDGRRQTLQLVGPDEADVRAGRISVASPLARALVGLGAGDEGELTLPRGLEVFEILAIE